uniref:GPI ethanolamine phosphate transferase 1 n=2 Tax=Aplanochytrium stocchinoi TaxID=215587 RepID=A0A6S8B6J1_9STRA
MATLDRGIAGVYHLFQEYFDDDKTAYVLSSDHGMGNKGAHGDGDPTNTRTPIIAWGAGIEPSKIKKRTIAKSIIDSGFTADEEEAFTEDWGLSHLERRDIEQADIAPLLSSLIGIPVPANSIGVLPLAHLKRNNYRAKAYISNAKQLVKQVEFKESNRKARLLWFFPFEEFQQALPELDAAEKAFADGEYEEAERLCANVMQVCKQALRYYQTYDRFYLLSLVILGYLGWITYTATEITFDEDHKNRQSWTKLSLATLLFFGILFIIQVIEQAPINYFAYWFFPAMFWTGSTRRHGIYSHWLSLAKANGPSLRKLIAYLIGLQMMVLGYTYREIYTVIFCGLGVWIFTVPELRGKMLSGKRKVSFQSHTGKIVSFPAKAIYVAWFTLCLVLGSFTLLPLEINDSAVLMSVGAILVLSILLLVYSTDVVGFSVFRGLQVSLIICSILTTLTTDASLRAKSGLPLFNQGLTWFCFIVAQLLPPYSYKTPLKRFLSVFAGLATPLILLSVNYEVLFYGFLGATMYLWLIVERCIMFARNQELKEKEEKIAHGVMTSVDDVRTAFFFVLFVHISFFGTGNIASLSSFQISSTYRFTTIFSPFLMGGLLIYKILLPYAMLATVVTSISKERIAGEISKLAPSQWFVLVLLLTDTMALNLLFWVRDEGSWQDIGTSISQFGFINSQVLFVPLIFWLSSYYMKGLEFSLVDLKVIKRK